MIDKTIKLTGEYPSDFKPDMIVEGIQQSCAALFFQTPPTSCPAVAAHPQALPVFFFVEIIVHISCKNFGRASRARQPRPKYPLFFTKNVDFWTFQKIDPEISAIFWEIFHQHFIFL